MKILILGGYAFAGSENAKLLIEHTDCKITLADRNLDKTCKFKYFKKYPKFF